MRLGRPRSTNRQYAPKQKRGTTMTFTAEELTALTQYVSAGMVLLRHSHPVVGRLKQGLTRLGLPHPPGL